MSFNIYSISGGYEINDDVPGGTTVTVFYQAIDNFGNSSLFGFTIAFVDNVPPTFDPLSLPPNLTVNCTGNFPVPDVEIHDNCEDQDIVLTLTFSENNNAALCTGGTITRTWVADDDLGNTASYVQTITVLPDNTPPVIANNLVNGSAPCATAMAQYTTWLNTQRANFSATDSGCGLMTLSDNAPAPALITSFCGEIMVTFTAKDNCNNISTVIRTFTITNNVAPMIQIPASDASGNCNQSNINTLFNNWISSHGGATATDDCSSIFWSTFPPAPSIHDTCDAAITVMFIAGDGCNNFDTTSASFTLTDDTPPSVTTDPNNLVLSCASPAVDSLLMDWLISHADATAHDLCTADEDLRKSFRIGANELSLEEVIEAWEDSLGAGCNDNVFIGGIGINNVKAYIPVQFVFDDKCENEAFKTGYFGITDNGRPQFVTNPQDSSFICSGANDWQEVFTGWYATAGGATFMDQCSDVTVQGNISADSAMQLLTVALDTACDQGVQVTIQFTLMDECGNLSMITPSATFSLQDTLPPVLEQQAMDFIASCTANGQEQLQQWLDTLGGFSASDGCGDLDYSFFWTDTSGMLQSGIPLAGPYPEVNILNCETGLTIQFTATDICQNSISDTALFSIIDTIAPVILLTDDTLHVSCTDTIPLTQPDVTDNCNSTIALSFSDTPGIDSCLGQPEMIIRTWLASDDCNNTATAVQVIFRTDTVAPTFELPADTVSFCSVDTLMLINLADNCDPSPQSSFTDVVEGMTCAQTLTRTWLVSDACGNTATAEQTFDLSDESPPDIEVSLGHFVYGCDEGSLAEAYMQWQTSVSITDGCSESSYFIAIPGSYVISDTSTWPGMALPDSIVLVCGETFLLEADLVAYDVCGNVIVESVSFSVQDTIPPVFLNCVDIITVLPDTSDCTGQVQLQVPDVSDICFPGDISLILVIDQVGSVQLDSVMTIDTVLSVGIHTAEWIATDCQGNISTCTTIIEIIDENAITISCPPDTLLFATEDTCTASLYVRPPSTSLGKCGQGVINLRMEVIGIAEPDSFAFQSDIDSVLVAFGAGVNEVMLIASDLTGDIDTCIYFVELRDTIDPVVVCQSDTVFIHPSGLDEIELEQTEILLSADDNCSLQSIVYDPLTVDCSSNGQLVAVDVTVSDASGNTAVCNTSIFVSTLPLIPSWERGLCDDTLRLFANIPPGPAQGYMFSWMGPNGFISDEENPVIPDTDSTFSGVYTLTITSDSGCVTSGEVEVIITSIAAPVITVSTDTVCEGSDLILSTLPYSGNTTYQWFHIDPSGDTTLTNTMEPVLIVEASPPGTHTFFAMVIQDTCASATGPGTDVFVADVPEIAIADPGTIFCIDDTLFLSPEVVVDSLDYLWTGPGGFLSMDPTPAGIPVSVIDSPFVFILNASSELCPASPDTLFVEIQQPPATPVISGDSVACEGGQITLVALPLADSFLWIDPQGNTTATIVNELTLTNVNEATEGNYSVIALINGCASDTSSAYFVTIDTALSITIVTETQVCEGDSITLTVTPNVSGDIQWTGPGGFSSQDLMPTVLAQQGTYHVALASAIGCDALDSVEIEVNILPVINSIETDADSCATGIDNVRLWANILPTSAGYQYQWEGPGGFASQDSSPVISNFNAGLNGTYSLFVQNGACITDTAFIEIEVTDSPAPPLISGETLYCFGDTIILTVDNPIDGLYTWMIGDSIFEIPSPGTLIIENAGMEYSGDVLLNVMVNGCTSANSMIQISVMEILFEPSIVTDLLACEGGSITLTSDAPAGAMLHWFGPNGFMSTERDPVITPVTPESAGEYFLFYTINDCSSDTASTEIMVQETVLPPIPEGDTEAICIDDPVMSNICISAGTGTQNATYEWYLNGSTILHEGLDSCIVVDGGLLTEGNNLITVTANVAGCHSDTSIAFVIIGHEIPSGMADAGPDVEACPGDVIIVDAADASPSTGMWSSTSPEVIFGDAFEPSTTVGELPPGQYVATWTLSYESCRDYSADSILIDVVSTPVVFNDTVEIPFGLTDEFIVTLNDSLYGLPFTLETVSSPTHGNALHAGNGIFRYTPNIGFVGTDMMTYRICSSVCPDECSEAIVVIRVGDEDDCFIPTLFTPNNDGVNDNLIVPCLETSLYPDNRIIIFNEWGDAVFEASPYQNDWRGTSSGSDLPVGTYFYIMDFGDGSTPKRSFLVLER